jgi:hypothetical protein
MQDSNAQRRRLPEAQGCGCSIANRTLPTDKPALWIRSFNPIQPSQNVNPAGAATIARERVFTGGRAPWKKPDREMATDVP